MTATAPKPAGSETDVYGCVLVDDDELVRLTWRLAAESAGIRLLALGSGQELLQGAEQVDKHAAIYIDVRLHGRLSGEQLARQLHAAGFTNLYFQTGYDPDSIPVQAMPWIRGVVGKGPPWPIEP